MSMNPSINPTINSPINSSSISGSPALLVETVTTTQQVADFCALAPTLAPSQFGQGQVDLHLIAYRAGVAVARCSLWWSAAPILAGQHVGCVGHYAASERAAAASCWQPPARICVLPDAPLLLGRWMVAPFDPIDW